MNLALQERQGESVVLRVSRSESTHRVKRAVGILVSVSLQLIVAAGSGEAACSIVTPCSSSPVNLGTIDNAVGTSTALGVNADGSVVVGQSATRSSDEHGNTFSHAFRSNFDGSLSDLGTLGNFAGSSIATGINWDGGVVVGASFTPFKDQFGAVLTHAFRWTNEEGMTDLGTIGSVVGNSRATGTNKDGSVVVGFSLAPQDTNGSSYYHAFRWTREGMLDLGTINSGSGFSAAYATSSDGLTIVGESAIPKIDNSFFSHAFRWTQSGGMADLGTLGDIPGYSVATAVSADGYVVVGQSSAQTATNLPVVHAFRWTNATGMTDLGTPAGDARSSRATGVSGDGTVIIGQYSGNCVECGERPFRWTVSGGMQDFNALLASAGVLPTGTILYSANAISKDGQFIVGNAKFDSDPAYIVRYSDQSAQPIYGFTSLSSLDDSIEQLSASRSCLMIQSANSSGSLLGYNQPINSRSSISGFGSGGPKAGGAAIQLSNDRLSILGGLAYLQQGCSQAQLEFPVVGALAIRINAVDGWGSRIFLEAGGWTAPTANFRFSRTYKNGADDISGTGTTSGDLFYGYGRVGAIIVDNSRDQVALSAEVSREWLSLDAYEETASPDNPFDAKVSSGQQALSSVKLRSQWSHTLNSCWDFTAWTSIAWGREDQNGLSAAVAGIGEVDRAQSSDLFWGEYGFRLGYNLDKFTSISVFANGTIANSDIESDVRAGLAVSSGF